MEFYAGFVFCFFFLSVVVFLFFRVLSGYNKREFPNSAWESATCFSSVTPTDLLIATADMKLRNEL